MMLTVPCEEPPWDLVAWWATRRARHQRLKQLLISQDGKDGRHSDDAIGSQQGSNDGVMTSRQISQNERDRAWGAGPIELPLRPGGEILAIIGPRESPVVIIGFDRDSEAHRGSGMGNLLSWVYIYGQRWWTRCHGEKD